VAAEIIVGIALFAAGVLLRLASSESRFALRARSPFPQTFPHAMVKPLPRGAVTRTRLPAPTHGRARNDTGRPAPPPTGLGLRA
jgi:hypothetical protein